MKRYISIDLQAMKENNLSLEEWVLLENIQFLSNNEYHACFASKKTLAEHLCVAERHLFRMISKLVESGFLSKNSFGHLVATAKWLRVSGTTYDKMSYPMQNVQSDYDKMSDDPMTKCHTKKDNLSVDIKREKEISELPTWLNLVAWEKWVQHRKEIRKPLTPTSTKQQLLLLEENKSDHVEIIEASISGGYMGLFPIKRDGNKALMDRCLNEKKRNYTVDPNNPF
jgi:hypothetical protein